MSSAGETFLYLHTTGRTSRLERTTELWFVEVDGRYFVVAETGAEAQWVKNLIADATIQLSVGERESRGRILSKRRGRARLLTDGVDDAVAARARTAMQAKYDWSDGLVVELSVLGQGAR